MTDRDNFGQEFVEDVASIERIIDGIHDLIKSEKNGNALLPLISALAVILTKRGVPDSAVDVILGLLKAGTEMHKPETGRP